jgi:hypothetical protein
MNRFLPINDHISLGRYSPQTPLPEHKRIERNSILPEMYAKPLHFFTRHNSTAVVRKSNPIIDLGAPGG